MVEIKLAVVAVWCGSETDLLFRIGLVLDKDDAAVPAVDVIMAGAGGLAANWRLWWWWLVVDGEEFARGTSAPPPLTATVVVFVLVAGGRAAGGDGGCWSRISWIASSDDNEDKMVGFVLLFLLLFNNITFVLC